MISALTNDDFESAPDRAYLRKALDEHDWVSLQDGVDALHPDRVFFTIDEIGQRDGVEAFLADAVSEHPESSLARTLLAVRRVHQGLAVRPVAGAERLSEKQVRRVAAFVTEAEQILIETCARWPGYSPAWAARVLSVRVLGLGRAEAFRRFGKVDAQSPHNFPAQFHMLQYLLPKWHGSAEAASTFAREKCAVAPDGSPTLAMIALLHLEEWARSGGGDQGHQYLTLPKVAEETTLVAERWLSGASTAVDGLSVQVNSVFAMYFWLAGENSRARTHLLAAAGRVSRVPWNSMDDREQRMSVMWQEVCELDIEKVPE